MTLSSLRYLTLAQLKKIAYDNKISIGELTKKNDLVQLIYDNLPADFDLSRYNKVDSGSKVSDIISDINSEMSLNAFIPKTEKNQKDENKNIVDSDEFLDYSESALFDVTNFEGRNSNISPPEKTQVTSFRTTPQSSSTPFSKKSFNQDTIYKPRFGPAQVVEAPTVNNIKPAISPSTQKQKLSSSTDNSEHQIIFKQAYTANKPINNLDKSRPSNQEYNYPKRANVSVPISNDISDTNIQDVEIDFLSDPQLIDVSGFLEILPNGFGFLRNSNFIAGSKDIYVSAGQIIRYTLKNGDFIEGKSGTKSEGMRHASLLLVEKINGKETLENQDRVNFDDLTAIYPNRKIVLESKKGKSSNSIRMIDFITPIGFGQRALIIAPENTGVTTLLIEISNAISRNNINSKVMFLSIDSNPEEITYLKDNTDIEVFHATFDKSPDVQVRVAELVFDRAERLAEDKNDVVIILDSMSSLCKAYQDSMSTSPKPYGSFNQVSFLTKAKQLFGVARNIREGGSITLLASINVDFSSRFDEIVFEEFKSKSNAELYLDDSLSSKLLYPSINFKKCIIKNPEFLLSKDDINNFNSIRKIFSNFDDDKILSQILDLINKTKNNEDLRKKLPEWLAIWDSK